MELEEVNFCNLFIKISVFSKWSIAAFPGSTPQLFITPCMYVYFWLPHEAIPEWSLGMRLCSTWKIQKNWLARETKAMVGTTTL